MTGKSLRFSVNKISYKTLLIVVVFLLIAILLLWRYVLPKNKAEAAWWNDGWNYRKAISVSNNSGSNQTNTQIKILNNYDLSSLVAAGKAQASLNDLRFTDINGSLLSYWIEDSTNNSVDVWAYVSSLPVSGTVIYMYYGNSSAISGVTKNGSAQLPALSCKSVKQSGNNINTIYYIDPTGGSVSDAIRIYCDLTTDNGGWMLIGKSDSIIYTHAPGFYTDGNVPTKSARGSINVFNLSLVDNSAEWAWIDTLNDQYVKFSLTKFDNIKVNPDSYTNVADDVGLRFISSNINNTSSLYHFSAVNNVELPVNAGAFSFTASAETITYGRWGTAYYAGGTQSGARIFMITNNGGYEGAYGKYGLQRYNPSPYIAINSALMVRESSYSIDTNFVYSIQSEESGGGPIAYWKFDEGVGTTAYDSVGANNGIISGATYTDESQCISGKCLYFDGVNNDYVEFNAPISSGSPFTISMWYRPTRINSSYDQLYSGTDNIDLQLFFNSSTKAINTSIENIEKSANFTLTSSNINNWYHIVWTYDNSRRKIYINGKLITDDADTTTFTKNDTRARIGSLLNGSNYKLQGFIDEPKIYPYARTADQIKQDYNSRGSASSNGSSVNLGSNARNSVALSEGLVGYWKMDEGVGTNITDSSGNNNTGTFGTGTSAPTWTSGKFGIGTSFDGNDYINAGTSSIFNLNNQFSFETWINVSSLTPSWQFIMGKSSYWGVNDAGLHIKSTGLEFFVDNCRDSDYFTITTNKWYHIVGVYNGTNRQLYVDGKLEKNSSCTGKTLNNAYNFSIGADNEFTYNYSGLMDDVRLYNRALSPAEVLALYNYAPGPVGYWDFNDGSGNSVVDKSGNNNNGTWSGTGSHWTQGKIGGGGNFNGINDYVNISESSSINIPYDITVSFWGKLAKPISIKTPLGKYQGVDSGWEFILNTDGTIRFDGRDKSTNYRTTGYSTLDISDNWHYITGQRQGGIWKLYIDGILNKSFNSGTFGDISGTGKSFEVGRSENSNGLATNGKIDDVKIYNYARTQKQIIEDMNAGAPATSAKSMVAYYKFDEGSGTTANNSGLGNSTSNGILYNSPIWTNEGKIGKTLSLNGSNTYIKTSGNLDAPANVTVTAWIKANNTSSTQYLVNQARDNYCSGYGILLSSNNLYFKINANSADDGCEASIGTSYLDTNKWHYIAGSYDGKTTKLYIDGVLKNSSVGANGNIVYKYNEVLNIGKMAYGEPTLYFPFNGLIDEVKIYNYALTDEEIKQDYNAGSAIQFGSTSQSIGGTTTSLEYCIPGDTSYCASPIAEYKMDEGSGTSSVDTSGNNLNTGFSGSPTWVQGKIGKALSFNGTTDYLNNTRKSLVGGLTFGVWIKTTSTDSSVVYAGNAAQNIIGDTTGGVAFGFGVHDGKVRYQHYAGAWSNVLGSTSVNDGLWHYVSVTHNSSGAIILYVDGKQDATGNIAYNGATGYNVIARGYSADHFTGQLDHFIIYNYARTPAQIAYDYNKGGPVGWWKFDECQGNIAHDWSGNQNNGTINIGSGGSQNSLGTCAVGTSAAWTNGSSGKINSSLNFDGADDLILINNVPKASSGTISVWIKPANSMVPPISSYPSLVRFNSDPGLYIQSGTAKPYVQTTIGTIVSNQSLVANQWQHLVSTYKVNGSNTDLIIYINGKQTGITSFSGTIPASNETLGISSATPFNGQVDDVRIYNYALTEEQIKQIYNGGAVNFR